jgi:hypothetical protein
MTPPPATNSSMQDVATAIGKSGRPARKAALGRERQFGERALLTLQRHCGLSKAVTQDLKKQTLNRHKLPRITGLTK